MKEVNKKKNPLWFRLLNLLILLPCVAFPLVFIMSVFLFDAPENMGLTILIAVAINAYPLYLFLLFRYNARLFRKIKSIAIVIPIVVGVLFIRLAIWPLVDSYGMGFANVLWPKLNKNELNISQGNIDLGQGYTRDSAHVYLRYGVLHLADIESFEVINSFWAKDKNAMYYDGRRVTHMDGKTFEYLGALYSRDSLHVYYEDEVVEGADPESFEYVRRQEGRDKNFCYEGNIRVDCDVLLKD